MSLERRIYYLERQLRMLLTDLGTRRIADVCMDSRCLAGFSGQVPHAAEQPHLCPILKRYDDDDADDRA